MKLISMFAIFLLVSLISHQLAIAGEDSYTCKVIHVYDLDDNGSLKISSWEKQFKGSDFSVSRATGKITGKVVPTLLANSTKVVNRGNEEYSFKSLAGFDVLNKPLSSGSENPERTASVQLLEIQEFFEGHRKPFVVMSMSGAGIVTGVCN